MTIWIPYMPPNWNEYIQIERGEKGKYTASALKRKEKQLMWVLCHGKKWTGGYPIEITFWAHYRSMRPDLDNTRIKGLLDGLVSCGVIENDNLKHIQGLRYYPIFDNKEGIEIEIKELNYDRLRKDS